MKNNELAVGVDEAPKGGDWTIQYWSKDGEALSVPSSVVHEGVKQLVQNGAEEPVHVTLGQNLIVTDLDDSTFTLGSVGVPLGSSGERLTIDDVRAGVARLQLGPDRDPPDVQHFLRKAYGRYTANKAAMPELGRLGRGVQGAWGARLLAIVSGLG